MFKLLFKFYYFYIFLLIECIRVRLSFKLDVVVVVIKQLNYVNEDILVVLGVIGQFEGVSYDVIVYFYKKNF